MIDQLKLFFNKQWKGDVFNRTQRRLTLLYSGLIILFLILFISIVYSLLYALIINEQEKDMITLVNQGDESSFNALLKSNSKNQDITVEGQDIFFYYIVTPTGELFAGDETNHQLKPELFRLVKNWRPKLGEIRYETMNVTFQFIIGHNQVERSQTENIRLMMGGRPLYFKNQFVGMLYIGKNVTASFKLLKTLLILFIGIALLFTGIALFISHYMSRKAMIPIKQAFTRQREFVADASHELRTPLSVMMSSIDALEMEEEENTESNLFSKRLLSNMKNEVKRMTRLVGDLLTLARSDSEGTELRREMTDAVPLVRKVYESVQPLAGEKNIQIQLHHPPTLYAYLDYEKVTQLVYILLDNAIKYTNEGGRVDVTLNGEQQGNQSILVMQVQDTGIGIKQEEYERIFDRFYRAEKSRSRQMGGHGLGLAIAKWIVEAHNGTINVTSVWGEGTTFTVKI